MTGVLSDSTGMHALRKKLQVKFHGCSSSRRDCHVAPRQHGFSAKHGAAPARDKMTLNVDGIVFAECVERLSGLNRLT